MPETTQASGYDRRRLLSWLGILASAKPKVYEQVSEATEISSLTYWLEIFLSAGIATFGLVESSPAVIIGGMLISPLMGPIMATGLALAAGDLYLGIKAVLNLVVSVTVSIAFSGFLVWLLPFHSATPEIIARTNPNLLDLGIALFSGLAGSIVVSRGPEKGATALPGVAIAVALMPPLCTMGFGFGSGLNLEIMGGAGLLFLTNLVAIVASAFFVFSLVGLNMAEVQSARVSSPKDALPARFLSQGVAAPAFTSGGPLLWRILMILVLLASISVPLFRALSQVANETLIRGTVQERLRRLVPSDALVSQQTTIGKDEIVIRMISTRALGDAKVEEAKQDLMRRTGRKVQLSVVAVASKSELSDAVQHLAQPNPVPVPPKSIVEIQKDLLDRVHLAIQDIWPSSDAPIQDFDVILGNTGLTVDVRYQSTKDLDKVAVKMVLQSLQTRLGMADLSLQTERVRMPRPNDKPARR